MNVAYFIRAASPEKSFNAHMPLTLPQARNQAWFPPSHKVVRLLQHPKSSGRHSKEFAEASSSTRAEKPKKLGSDVRRFFLTLSLRANEAAWKGASKPFLSANLFHHTMWWALPAGNHSTVLKLRSFRKFSNWLKWSGSATSLLGLQCLNHTS